MSIFADMMTLDKKKPDGSLIDLEDNFFGKIENGTELFRALADDTIPEIADQNVSRGSLMDDLIASAECFAHL